MTTRTRSISDSNGPPVFLRLIADDASIDFGIGAVGRSQVALGCDDDDITQVSFCRYRHNETLNPIPECLATRKASTALNLFPNPRYRLGGCPASTDRSSEPSHWLTFVAQAAPGNQATR